MRLFFDIVVAVCYVFVISDCIQEFSYERPVEYIVPVKKYVIQETLKNLIVYVVIL